ncbi:MAG: pyridoxal phosphate-dependent aminotransferase [Candidatus Dormibacteria bacterium]
MSRFRRASLGPDFGYTPGEQPEGDEWLKLNTNEAPLQPSPAVVPAVAAAAKELRRYPNPYGEPLRSALALHHGVEPPEVFVANGADQVLDCCYRAFAEPGAAVVHGTPTYSLLPVLARVFSLRDIALPLGGDGTLPQELATTEAPLRVVVNPNSPTGLWIAPDALEQQLAAAAGVVVIDEAYCDFAPASVVPLLSRHPSWLVVRTFSKGYALAGLRVGYAVGGAGVIADLLAVKDSYPVDRCAIAGAAAALGDIEHHSRLVETVRTQRARLTDALRGAGWDVLPSQTNFVFARPPASLHASAVAAGLRERRILVRHFSHPGIDDRLRITVGDAAAIDRLLAGIAETTATHAAG